ncbi:two-component system, sensor histidine kinase [Anaerolineae bacterium]|nr:two-component system, sensor histidine kinase [Anaerolineae bacterium]
MDFTPYSLPLMLAAGVSLWLAGIVWRRRPGPGVYPFVILMLAVVWWSVFYALELSASSASAKLLLAGLQYVGITIVPPAWLLFVLQYTGNERTAFLKYWRLLLIEPILITVLAATNPLHTLFYSGYTLLPQGTFTLLKVKGGTFYWVNPVYAYVLLFVATVILVRAMIRSPQIYRDQAFALLIAVLAPWIANFMYLSGVSPFPGLDLTPFAFTITGLATGWGLIRFRLLDIVPVARDKIVETMSDAVFVLDAQSRIVDINPAALNLLKADAGKVIGTLAQETFAPYASLIEPLKGMTEGRTEVTVPGTPKRYYEVLVSPLRNADGRLSGRTFVLHEITSLKEINLALSEARDQAQESSRLKSEFLSTMSHELRTPLNAIIGFLGIVQQQANLDEKNAHRINRARSNSERLLQLINNILDIGRIESQRIEVISTPIVIRPFIHKICAQVEPLAEEKKLSFQSEISPQVPETIMGDEDLLTKIITNLLGNAFKFTDKGSVRLNIQRDQDFWTITVQDTGIGIAPHMRELIFERFRQVDASAARRYGGSGLGLSIVSSLCQEMGGTISVDGELNEGSTFTVRLPLRVPENTSLTAEDRNRSSERVVHVGD